MIKFALIKERKFPPDRRVVFSPEKLKEVVAAFPWASFKVEASEVRVFKDLRTTQHYAKIVDRKISDDMQVLREKLVLNSKKHEKENSKKS